MEAIKELHGQLCRQIGEAHARLMKDVEQIRERQKDWALSDLERRVRWAKYTLEVADLEREKLHIERTLYQVANVGTPEAYQSITG